jgi:hypothetical protein
MPVRHFYEREVMDESGIPIEEQDGDTVAPEQEPDALPADPSEERAADGPDEEASDTPVDPDDAESASDEATDV